MSPVQNFEQHSRHLVEPDLLIQARLQMVMEFVDNPEHKLRNTPKEIVSFLQKLSQVDKQNFTPVALEEWDRKYLELLYGICADSNKYPLSLRQEVFQKVERLFMLGLRARDPEIRMKFFSHESVGKTLFTRLQFIIQIQDWGALSDVFWLKQGLDLLLAILVEDKPITLAPNYARVQPLLVSSSPMESSVMQLKVNDVSDGTEDAPLTFETVVLKHAQFLNSMSKLQVRIVRWTGKTQWGWRTQELKRLPTSS